MFGERGCLLLFTLNYNIGGAGWGGRKGKKETMGACKQSCPRAGPGRPSSIVEGDVSARSQLCPAFPPARIRSHLIFQEHFLFFFFFFSPSTKRSSRCFSNLLNSLPPSLKRGGGLPFLHLLV